MDRSRLEKNIRTQKEKNQALAASGNQQKIYDLLEEPSEADMQYAKSSSESICESCGASFKQEYMKSNKDFTQYRTCHRCRWAKAVHSKQTKAIDEHGAGVVTGNAMVHEIPYKPHPWQKKFREDFFQDGIRFGIISGGARSGKDYCCVMILYEVFVSIYNEFRIIHKPSMVPSFRFWLVAPTERLAKQNWQQLVKFFPKEWIVSIRDSDMIMSTIGGGIIEVRSAHDPDSLVSVAVDFCIITEAARILKLKEAWSNIEDRLNSPGAGLDGEGGRAVINSSPLGKNFFFKMFNWGNKSHPTYTSDFVSIRVKSSDNPEVAERYAKPVKTKDGRTITYGESLRQRKGRRFLQDNEAEFLSSGGTVFENFRENCVYDIYITERGKMSPPQIRARIIEWQSPKFGETYRVGYDPASGSSKDLPVLVIREMNTSNIVRAVNLHGLTDDDQLDAVADWARRYNDATVMLLETGNLLAAGQLSKRGIDVIPLAEGSGKKFRYISATRLAMEEDNVHVLDDGSTEMESFILQVEDYTEHEKSGKFSNDTQDNDDYVSALYACYYDYGDFVEVTKHYSPKLKSLGRKVGR